MLRLIKKRPLWLVVFVGGDESTAGDERVVKTYIEKVVNTVGLPQPRYKTMRIPRAKVRAFPEGVPVKHELSERFSDAILNPLINKKRNIGATDAALVIFRNAFPNDDVFRATLEDCRFDSSVFHLVCSWTDFLEGIDKRLSCCNRCCSTCGELGSSCKHSCLPRLLWLMFNEDGTVLDVIKAKRI